MKKGETMSRKTDLILFTTSFLSGVVTGLLLSPNRGKDSRRWFSKNLLIDSRWTEMQNQAITQKGSQKLLTFKTKVNQGIQQHIPNLYKATDTIQLSEKDIPGE